MHRALAIPEIVRIILHCADHAILPPLARTCRAFCDPALDLLWEDKDGLRHLLRCMPDGLWEPVAQDDDDEDISDEQLYLTRPVVPADWDRFLFYSRRVKTFTFDVDSEIAYCSSSVDILRISFPGPVLFPNLRTLLWLSGSCGTIRHIRLFLAPHLRKLVLDSLDSVADLSVLPTLVTQCPGLAEVDIAMPDRLLRFLGNLYTSVVSLHRLVTLSIPSIDDSVLEHLSRMPTLTSLTLKRQNALSAPRTSSGESVFPTLRSLTITTRVADVLPTIVPLLTEAPLESLNIQLAACRGTATFVAWCKALASDCACGHNSLRHLYLREVAPTGVRISLPAVSPVVQGVHIRPLYSFKELKSVWLYPPRGFDLDDSAMDELARAWPRLALLDLGGDRASSSGSPSHITLSALLSFAQHCPRLSSLPLNTSSQAPTPALNHGTRRIQQGRLHTLGVQSCPCSDVYWVAKFLSSVFPALRAVRTDLDGRFLEGHLALGVRRQNWKDVQKLLPLLRSVREEEQQWTESSGRSG
ncbi:hypothetical protein FB45DRAFT_841681 [Roridomyces roridus]|uniref:F-box domain-containing protein n=1 Tax=Roridomyces roridus TaxID=1738132 RepID=A0AAD7BBM3_9AGAR|nr:hypothetical protein FB45DRAFT_841681 [Roridomyces roridus]